MGGRSNVQNEILCRFVFPERPGALMKFLDVFSPRWNISLFHYRGQVVIQHLFLLKILYFNIDYAKNFKFSFLSHD